MFLSTEIFSKRRKIYAWFEEKPELTCPRCWRDYVHTDDSHSQGKIDTFLIEIVVNILIMNAQSELSWINMEHGSYLNIAAS